VQHLLPPRQLHQQQGLRLGLSGPQVAQRGLWAVPMELQVSPSLVQLVAVVRLVSPLVGL
jgi:hypothetical protein